MATKQKRFNIALYGVIDIMEPIFKKQLHGHNLAMYPHTLQERKGALDPKIDILGVRSASKVTAHTIRRLKNLKMITTLTTGFDHIDLKAAETRSIPVTNVPTYGSQTVAQHAVSLILALSRKLFPSVKRVKEGGYDFHGLRGFDLEKKTIGIVGTGNIGRHVIQMLAGFGVKIIAFDAFPNTKLEKKLGFKYVNYAQLLKRSDVISFHVPLIPPTQHMFNKDNISSTKKGVYIINTARGGIIDSEALLHGLQTGHVAGAGLDVMGDEQYLNHPELLVYTEGKEREIREGFMNARLIDHPNVIVTPHNAFNSHESLQRIAVTTSKTISAFAKGRVLNSVL